MQPIAITFKNYKVNPFTGRGNGELMVIHKCLNCGRISPNRIAGDDKEYQILSVLEESTRLNIQLRNQIIKLGLELITTKNQEEALISLFGDNYQNLIRSHIL